MHFDRHVLTAKDIMTRSVITLAPHSDVFEAIKVLTSRHISGAPVMDGGDLVGILSEKDCLKVLASESFHEALAGEVRDYMTSNLTTVGPETDIFFIAGIFLSNNIRRVPVLDGDKLVGIAVMQKQLRPRQYPDYREPK